jgi:phosphate transport system permease protein
MNQTSLSGDSLKAAPIGEALSNKRRIRFMGMTVDEWIRNYFGGNALIAIFVLFLIMALLLKEGFGFMPMNKENLEVYRQGGLEYVDFFRKDIDSFSMMGRYLNDLRLKQYKSLKLQGKSFEEINQLLVPLDTFKNSFDGLIAEHDVILTEMVDHASAVKGRVLENESRTAQQKTLRGAGMNEDANKIVLESINFTQEAEPLRAILPRIKEANVKIIVELENLAKSLPTLPDTKLEARLPQFSTWISDYAVELKATEQQMAAWQPLEPIPAWKSFTTFLFGSRWLTASFWQDWYGVVPLFVGSAMIATLALTIAVPFGIAAAIYVNQVASFKEQNFIKPYIEFISAIPSVVLGFFGIAVLGTLVRDISNWEALAWIPFFPFSERLNIFTAGCLLGLMAIPTIFTLAEDALNNVPRYFVEASIALGATRFQTIVRIMIPASLSGIVSAILLGLGRVIGETMVVLLCAGNRIQIPDFSAGLGAIFAPAHTMTGIIAQEMGEVVRGSIHYRALFMVGILLFFISLILNYAAQWVVKKYRISIG